MACRRLDTFNHTGKIRFENCCHCAGSAGTGERALRVSVEAALRAGIFKASGSFDPLGLSVGARSSFPHP